MPVKRTGWIALGVLCVFLVGTVAVSFAQSASIVWHGVGSGGRLEQGNVSLENTLGQPVVGVSSSGDNTLCAGFWCLVSARYEVYVPLILKAYSR
jgi:hypothetical protein